MKGIEKFINKPGPYTLKFESRPEYLYAFVGSGKDSLEVSKDFWLKVLTECKKREYGKALIEEDLDGEIPLVEVYNLATWLTELEFNDIQVAFVDRRIEHKESNKFGELVSNNRGFRAGVFDSIEEAEKWLGAD